MFIRRPIATSLLMAAVILLGLLGYKLLPISALPSVDFPTIQVFAQLPGASPDVMASSVTTPLERQFGQIPGLASMNSTSSFGNATITLQFVLDREIDAAEDVQAAINAAAGVLPANLPNPPTYNKVNPADTAILSLTISTGFVVDDAIVMIENIVRYIEAGETPLDAALKGSRQIGFTVVSLSVSLSAVFIPLLFMTGIVGRLFREFAVTLSAAVVVSAVISLTLTPMMCAKLLQPEVMEDPTGKDKQGQNWFYRATERFFEGMLAFYERGLKWVFKNQLFTLLIAVATLVGTIGLYLIIPKGLLPQQDTGVIIGVTDAAQSISFQAMVDRQRAVADIVRRDPDVQTVSSFVGAGSVNATINTGRLTVVLKPRRNRKSNAEEIINRLRGATAGVQGIPLFTQAVQDLQLDSRVSRTQYQYVLQDADPGELGEWTQKLLDKLRALPELTDVASDQQRSGQQLDVTVDRDQASRYNVLTQAVDNTLYDAFGQRQVSVIYTQLNQYRVILEVEPGFRDAPDALDKIYVKSTTGQLIPLSTIARTPPPRRLCPSRARGSFPRRHYLST